MLRIGIFIFAVVLISSLTMERRNIANERVAPSTSSTLDGVYEFVSESTVLTAPKRSVQERISAQWSGVWQFQSGHYTQVLMKRRRDNFFNSKTLGDLGFESSAGSYEIQEENILLRRRYSFNPLNVDGFVLMAYRTDGNTLTLTQTLHPYVEDLREGTITTVLRRVK